MRCMLAVEMRVVSFGLSRKDVSKYEQADLGDAWERHRESDAWTEQEGGLEVRARRLEVIGRVGKLGRLKVLEGLARVVVRDLVAVGTAEQRVDIPGEGEREREGEGGSSSVSTYSTALESRGA